MDEDGQSKMSRTGVVLAVGGGGAAEGGRAQRHRVERAEPGKHRRFGSLREERRMTQGEPLRVEIESLADRVKERGGYDILEVGYSRSAGPSVVEAIEKAVVQGARRVIVVPVIFTGGEIDIRDELTSLRGRYPDIEIIYGEASIRPDEHADLIISKIREHDRLYVPSEAELGLSRLSDLRTGERGVVSDFVAGHTLVSRLSALGFTPEARVTMVQNFGHGPVIVNIRDTRIALGRGEASKVRVRRFEDEQQSS